MKYLICLFILLSCQRHVPTKKQVTVIAHRGASAYLPEHTLESAAMAHGFGVHFIEPDVVMTKDHKLVVLHDVHIDTTTNVAEVFPNKKRSDGRFYALDFTLKELKTLTVHERIDPEKKNPVFPKRFPQKKSRFEIPTLEEMIELVQGLNQSTGRKIGLYPEIKNPEFHEGQGFDITPAVLKVLRDYGYEESKDIYIQCFVPQTLKRLRFQYKTKIPLIQLVADNSWKESSVDYSQMLTSEGLKEISYYADGIAPWIPQILNANGEPTPVVSLAHRYNLKVHSYTHRPEEIPTAFKTEEEFFKKLFYEMEVDGIFSDASDRVLQFLRVNP